MGVRYTSVSVILSMIRIFLNIPFILFLSSKCNNRCRIKHKSQSYKEEREKNQQIIYLNIHIRSNCRISSVTSDKFAIFQATYLLGYYSKSIFIMEGETTMLFTIASIFLSISHKVTSTKKNDMGSSFDIKALSFKTYMKPKDTHRSRSCTRVSIRVGNSLLISWITRVSTSTSSISFSWR